VSEVKSPCKNICHLVNRVTHMLCVGCFRTQDEIVQWSEYSDKEKNQVLIRIRKEHGIS